MIEIVKQLSKYETDELHQIIRNRSRHQRMRSYKDKREDIEFWIKTFELPGNHILEDIIREFEFKEGNVLDMWMLMTAITNLTKEKDVGFSEKTVQELEDLLLVEVLRKTEKYLDLLESSERLKIRNSLHQYLEQRFGPGPIEEEPFVVGDQMTPYGLIIATKIGITALSCLLGARFSHSVYTLLTTSYGLLMGPMAWILDTPGKRGIFANPAMGMQQRHILRLTLFVTFCVLLKNQRQTPEVVIASKH